MVHRQSSRTISRRQVISAAIPLALGAVFTRPAFAVQVAELSRSLSFRHMHTDEQVTTIYKARGRYIPNGVAQINHILRDWRTDETVAIDPKLLDMIWDLQKILGSRAPVDIVSGYRTQETNEMLASTNPGVAEHSQHLLGKALDFRLADRTLDKIRKVAVVLRRGGVGYYPRSGFVHVDTGRVRAW